MDLYICSTYYHVLITCLKAIDNKKIVIGITDYIPEAKALFSRAKESSLFLEAVFLNRYEPSNRIERLYWRKTLIKRIEENESIDFLKYDNIVVYMDLICYALYFKEKGIGYHIIEDGFDTFKVILNSPFREMVERNDTLKQKILSYLFPYYIRNTRYYLDSECVLSIEVNDKNGIAIDNNDERVKEVPKAILYSRIDESSENILGVFLEEKDIEDLEIDNIALVLTYCFTNDKVLKNENEQIKLYKEVFNRYSSYGYNIVIKPHPRDEVDYSSLGCKIMNKNFPAELLKYTIDKKVARYVSIFSSSGNNFDATKMDYYKTIEDFYESCN